MKAAHQIASVVVCWMFSITMNAQPSDSDRLGMALDYYCSGKIEEALVIFERLDRQYQLNPRFHAYMGMCYYHERIYDLACKYFDEAIPHLGGFSPIERFSYYYSAGDSHFRLEEYAAALPYFEQALTVCPEQRRTDVLSLLEWCRKMTSPTTDAITDESETEGKTAAEEDSIPEKEPSAEEKTAKETVVESESMEPTAPQ